MTGHELAQRLEELKLSADQLAELLGRHQDEVKGWLATRRSLPRSLTRNIEFLLAVHARDEAIKASGLPECELMSEKPIPAADDDEGWEKFIAESEEHSHGCEVCQKRVAFIATLEPLPPQPIPGHVRLLVRFADFVESLPRWARPAVLGALIVAALTLFRAILAVVLGRAQVTPGLALIVLAAMGVGAYGGLVGGLAYYFVRARFRRFGRMGDYLTGIVCVYAYLAAFGIPLALFVDDDMFRSGASWIVVLVLGAVFGVVIGHNWFRSTPVAVAQTAPDQA